MSSLRVVETSVGERDEGGVGERVAADPNHCLNDDGDYRGGEAEEQPGQQRGVAVGDIDRGQAEQGEHAGQHEQDAGDQSAAAAVEQPAGVDGELLGLRVRATACSS
jgi:hypothetical protein